MDTKKLRQKILDLAIHGKLVPQDPNDEPASVLLERVRAEKERLIKEGKIKRSRKSAKTSDTPHYPKDVPFEVPEGWVWCKLDDLAFYKKGPFGSSLTKAMFVPIGDDTYKVYEQKNAIQKDCTLGTYYISKEKYDSLSGFAIQPFDIIVSCAGTIGETYVLPQYIKKGIINQALMFIRLYCREIEQFYLLYFDFILKEEANIRSKGTAIKNIPPFDVLKNFYIPIPPLKEQRRILEEVNKWLSFVESIETSTLDLQTTIKQTKSKILDLAIHGKLVPQDPNDEPAIELLKRINPDFKPCDNGHYPIGWIETILGELFNHNTGKALNSSNKEGVMKDYLTTSNVYWNKFDFTVIKQMPFKEIELDKCTVTKGDLLVCEGGDIGRSAIWRYDYDICIQNHIHRLRPKIDLCVSFYYYTLAYLKENNLIGGKGIGLLGLSSNALHKIEVPLPPLAEQQRIVQKIEELFSVLDNIQKALEV
ncbi:restriction endonuclease subunit S [Prevotella amnii]|uniref:restriction endonuclease subunit S n=1 Tax=Prevotella amnii TaxID=419005 RepID=UPI00336AA9BE